MFVTFLVDICFGLNIFISNQFIHYNTIFNHANIRIRTEARAYQVLLLYLFCRHPSLNFFEHV